MYHEVDIFIQSFKHDMFTAVELQSNSLKISYFCNWIFINSKEASALRNRIIFKKKHPKLRKI